MPDASDAGAVIGGQLLQSGAGEVGPLSAPLTVSTQRWIVETSLVRAKWPERAVERHVDVVVVVLVAAGRAQQREHRHQRKAGSARASAALPEAAR